MKRARQQAISRVRLLWGTTPTSSDSGNQHWSSRTTAAAITATEAMETMENPPTTTCETSTAAATPAAAAGNNNSQHLRVPRSGGGGTVTTSSSGGRHRRRRHRSGPGRPRDGTWTRRAVETALRKKQAPGFALDDCLRKKRQTWLHIVCEWWHDVDVIDCLLLDSENNNNNNAVLLLIPDAHGCLPLHRFCRSLEWPEAATPPYMVLDNKNNSNNNQQHDHVLAILHRLLEVAPKAAQHADDEGRLPLHYVLHRGATAAIVTALLQVYPPAISTRTHPPNYSANTSSSTSGDLPLDVAMGKRYKETNASSAVILQLVETAPETLIQPPDQAPDWFYFPLEQWMRQRFYRPTIDDRTFNAILLDFRARQAWECLAGLLWHYYRHYITTTATNSPTIPPFQPALRSLDQYAFVPTAVALLAAAGGHAVLPEIRDVVPSVWWRRRDPFTGQLPLELALQQPTTKRHCKKYAASLYELLLASPCIQNTYLYRTNNGNNNHNEATLPPPPPEASEQVGKRRKRLLEVLEDIVEAYPLARQAEYTRDARNSSWLLHGLASRPEVCPDSTLVDALGDLFPEQTRVCDLHGHTPLLCSLQAPFLSVVIWKGRTVAVQDGSRRNKYLRRFGATVCPNDNDNTQHWHWEMVATLLRRDPYAARLTDAHGQFPLHHAVATTSSSTDPLVPRNLLLELVEAWPSALEQTNRHGFFPFQTAAQSSSLDNIYECLRRAPMLVVSRNS